MCERNQETPGLLDELKTCTTWEIKCNVAYSTSHIRNQISFFNFCMLHLVFGARSCRSTHVEVGGRLVRVTSLLPCGSLRAIRLRCKRLYPQSLLTNQENKIRRRVLMGTNHIKTTAVRHFGHWQGWFPFSNSLSSHQDEEGSWKDRESQSHEDQWGSCSPAAGRLETLVFLFASEGRKKKTTP